MGAKANAYRIRTAAVNKGAQTVGSLHVPNEIVNLVNAEQHFTVELTEEGILYRPLDIAEPVVEVPSWVSHA